MKARLASVLASVIISLALLGPIHGNASAEPQELPFRGHYAGAVILQNGLMTLNGVGEATHLGRTSLSIVSSPRVGQEIVVNFVDKDRIRGYVSAPKDKVLAAEAPTLRKQ